MLSGFFGPYPFAAAGGIFTGENTGFALETATRPVYTGSVDDLDTVVHELAHQWYGDDVTDRAMVRHLPERMLRLLRRWLYNEKVNGDDLDANWKQRMRNSVNRAGVLAVAAGRHGSGQRVHPGLRPGPARAARAAQRDRRRRILQDPQGLAGDLRRQERHVRRPRGVRQTLAGKDLTPFMDAWFRGTTVPAMEFRYPGDLGN